MSSQMLIVFALFLDRIQNGHNGANDPVERAMAAFSFLLFLTYAFLGVLLLYFRREIVKEGVFLHHQHRTRLNAPPPLRSLSLSIVFTRSSLPLFLFNRTRCQPEHRISS
jgi:hypothetical protein